MLTHYIIEKYDLRMGFFRLEIKGYYPNLMYVYITLTVVGFP